MTLKKRFLEIARPLRSQFDGTDHAVRIFIAKSVWSRVLADLAEEIEYDNFKSEVVRPQGGAGAAYECALRDLWSVMYKLQK